MVSRARNDRFAKRYSGWTSLGDILFSRLVVLRGKTSSYIIEELCADSGWARKAFRGSMPDHRWSLPLGPATGARSSLLLAGDGARRSMSHQGSPRSWEQIFKCDFAAEVRKKKRPSGPDQILCHKLRGGRGFLKSLLCSQSSDFA